MWAQDRTSELTIGRRTAPGTKSADSPRRRARSRSRCQSSRGCASPPRSSSATRGAKPASRRPSSRCIWPGCPRAASRTSARSCRARASPPTPCRTPTTRPSRRSRNGGAGRWTASTHTSMSTAWIGYTKLDSFVRAGRVRRSPWQTRSTPGISPTSSSGR